MRWNWWYFRCTKTLSWLLQHQGFKFPVSVASNIIIVKYYFSFQAVVINTRSFSVIHAFLSISLTHCPFTFYQSQWNSIIDNNVIFFFDQVRLMISDTARHKLLVLCGQCSENTGELILQSGSFSFFNFIDIFTDQEVS